jgi:cardiolipin synthase
MTIANNKTINFTVAFTAAFLGACVGQARLPFDETDDGTDNVQFIRSGVTAVQGGVLFARSFHVDPVNRPVSNAMSLGSYLLKSTTGFMRRMVIGTVEFPSLEAQQIPEISNAEGMDLEKWEKDLDRISGRKSSYGAVDFLVDGEAYFPRMLDAVRNAKHSIDIRTYIFDNDDYAVKVADELKDMSGTVDVRVMFDGIGNLAALRTTPESMPDDFQRPISMERYLERNSKVRVRTLSNPWLTGDHTKTTIVDRKIAFIGGMNIGREYRYDWHDLMMEVRGPIVDQLQYDTDKAWAKASVFGDVARFLAFIAGKQKHSDDTGYPLRLLYTKNFDSQIYRSQLEAIRRARSYILIENSYFSDDATLFELARARRRGVDVRVILPAEGNHGSLNASNLVAINRMLDNGIRVYRFPGMSHVKAAIVDGWASVGTANFDKLSLQVNKEVNVATSHRETVNQLLDRVFLQDLDRSTEIDQKVTVTLQARLLEIVTDEAL